MNGARSVQVRRGSYHDSVSLMQASRTVAGGEGVRAALVAMATDLNVDLLAGMGFEVPEGVGPNDLLVAVHADDEPAIEAAHAALEAALARPSGGGAGSGSTGAAAPPATLGSAVRRTDAALALVSVPGDHAFTEAMDALRAGASVMVFSDNVPVAQEIALKREAARRGLLVMGPDCGTAVVAGVGLGFANVVRPGPVGIVAASGTGAQQLMCLLDGAGVGISHCLGVGGRDLSAEVGGLSTRAALELLDADPATELIVLVSKPPAPAVAAAVEEFAGALSTPVQLALLGPGRPDLTAAAAAAVGAVGGHWEEPRWWSAAAERSGAYRGLRGVFSGGTLCDEAMLIASAAVGRVWSNIPLDPAWRLVGRPGAGEHAMVDYGDDEMTRGRAHPMIDSSLRLAAIEAASGEAGVLLLDVVLGHGAHPDPASELAPAIAAALSAAGTARAARSAVSGQTGSTGSAASAGSGQLGSAGHDLAVIVSLCGTDGDPQGLERQALAFVEAGASVHLSNAAAAREALELLS